jgi:2-polyprenyl-3-methyl-5-hydroxy-6-metoxy-1,4-benzoquinol methylase
MSSDKKTEQEIDDCINRVKETFPIKGYVSEDKRREYAVIAGLVKRYLPTGGRVLDFGAGPLDKTAVLAGLGYETCACDDLQDYWHNGKKELILDFAKGNRIDYYVISEEKTLEDFIEGHGQFDMVMLHDVIEHLHHSPKNLLNKLLAAAREQAFLFITVPNALNIRKRICVMLGKTNYAPYPSFYWSPEPWRGHIREYCLEDLRLLAEYLNLDTVELRDVSFMLRRVPKGFRWLYEAASNFIGGTKDTLLFIGRKKIGWTPRYEIDKQLYAKIMNRLSSNVYGQ